MEAHLSGSIVPDDIRTPLVFDTTTFGYPDDIQDPPPTTLGPGGPNVVMLHHLFLNAYNSLNNAYIRMK